MRGPSRPPRSSPSMAAQSGASRGWARRAAIAYARMPMGRGVVDLTETLGPATVLWPGSERVERRVVAHHATEGMYGQVWRTPEHAGTHLDAPAHFAPEGVRADQIPAERLVVDCAVLDVRERCAADADFMLEAEQLRAI